MENQGFKFMSIGNSSVVFYNKMSINKSNVGKSLKSKSNLEQSYKSHHLTAKSKKQINKIIYHWSNCVELNQQLKKNHKNIKRRSLAMITLTLPGKQQLTDKQCNSQLLSPFMNRLKKLRPNIHYLWVAEKQKNGNIHYHIIIDLFISKIWIRTVWNKILAGTVEMQEYTRKYNKTNPPSTEIDTLRNIKSSGAYITKYITKLDDIQQIESKKWDCDNELLKLSTICLTSKSWYIQEFAHYSQYFEIQKYEKDFFQIFTFKTHFHQSFKFLNVYHDVIPQLLFYYSGIYSELNLLQITDKQTIKEVRPPQTIQCNLDF